MTKTTVVEEVMYLIFQTIKTDKMQLGDRFQSERELAERWNVSRTSVREAMNSLALSHVVSIKPGSGIYLINLPDYLVHQYEVESAMRTTQEADSALRMEARMILEPALVRLAAQRITDSQIAELEDIVATMRKRIEQGHLQGYAIDDINFHSCYIRAANNHYLYKAMQNYWNASPDLYYIFEKLPGLEKETYLQHCMILEALKKRDPDLSEHLMLEHLYYGEKQRIRVKYLLEMELPEL